MSVMIGILDRLTNTLSSNCRESVDHHPTPFDVSRVSVVNSFETSKFYLIARSGVPILSNIAYYLALRSRIGDLARSKDLTAHYL